MEKLKEYYDWMLNEGGGEISGEWEEMKSYVEGNFDSFEDFINNEIYLLSELDEDLVEKIKIKYLN